LVRYLGWKARQLGQECLAWADLDAPLPTGDRPSTWSWDEAAGLVADAFGGFHPKLADFAREAVLGRWIDALPREGRRPGGFCTELPRSNESRIFMTFTGSLEHASVLAHELGHAFHNRVLAGVPASRAEIVSATAETASTFAEAVLRDRLLASSADPVFRTFMIDQQLQAAFLMDIPARFAFERRLFALRRDGVFDPDVLDAEMLAAQDHAYGKGLADGFARFWCAKLHFYIPEFGFYNWPYTFGYLFSAAVHRRAVAEGPSFLATFEELLGRTGWQDTEGLARDVLGVDLTDPAFWREAARPIVEQVDALTAVA
jgi:oligoendopeptidase F